jgi:protein SYS1
MPLYGKDVWDPRLITAQICTVQCVHYIAQGFVFGLFHLLFGSRLHLDLFFAWETTTVLDAPGWMVICNSLIVALFGAVSLLFVVERAKKCFDFAFTVYFLHWLATMIYSGFPSSWDWWVVNTGCMIVMAVAGEQLCMRTELADISLENIRDVWGGSASNKIKNSIAIIV